jgi:drug/metabolite transporter (DMT)-like permease
VNDRRAATWVPAFVALAAIWGCSFLFIKVAVEQLGPLYVTLGRVGIGALTLLVALAAMRQRLPRDPRLWLHLFVVAALMNAAPFTLFGFGEQRVSSVLAGIWNATTPLVTLVVLLAVFPQERPTASRVAGLLVGFLGVLTVLGVWRGVGGAALTGQLMCLGAATCYGFGLPYIRRFVAGRPEPGVSIAAAQLLLATAQLAVLTPLVGGTAPDVAHLRVRVVLAVLALGALGTGIAFLLNYRVIRLVGAGTTSMVTYLMPVFATVAGVLVLGEGITWYEPVGAVVILAGVAVSQGLLRRRRRAAQAAWAPDHSRSRSTDQVLTTPSTGTAQRAARSQPLGSQSS